MAREIGRVEAIFRYPVKSMCGEQLDAATLGWHGLDGDRRLALRRLDNHSDFPWLTARKLPELLLHTPQHHVDGAARDVPTHIRAPDGCEWPVFSKDLAGRFSALHGAPVEMIQLRHGIFDDAAVSVITTGTVEEVCRLAGTPSDVRRFRPNILIHATVPFSEDAWVGSVLVFGTAQDAAAVALTMPDVRCAMVNFDPDTAQASPEVLKAVARANAAKAGVYGAVTRVGQIAVGESVFLR